MSDLTDRALDTASRTGRDIRRRPRRPAPRGEHLGQDRPGRGRRLGRERRVRRPRPRRRCVGLRLVARPDRHRGRSGRGRGRPDRPGERDRPPRTGPGSTTARPPTGRTRRRSSRTRSRSRSRPRSRTCSPPTRPPAAVKGIAFTESIVRRPARVEDLRRDRRQPDRAGHHPRRRGGRGQRHRRRRAPAPELPGLGRRLAGGRLRVHPGSRPGRHRPSRSPTRRSRS